MNRFTEDWKDADPDIPELIEAKKRLAVLSGVESVAMRNGVEFPRAFRPSGRFANG